MKLLILLLISSSIFASTYRIKIASIFSTQIRKELSNKGIDFGHGSGNAIDIFTSLPKVKLESIISYPFEVIEVEKSRPYNQKKKSINDYYDYAETVQALRQLEANHSQYAKVYNLNERYEAETTVDGNSIMALKVGKNPNAIEAKAKIIFIGQHHARELMTHHAVMDIASKLLAELSQKKENALETIESSSVWFVPVVNPDGLNYVFNRNNMWRKNRRLNDNGTYGVDLNRNYQFEWGTCGSNSSTPSSDIYKGSHAHSEIEVALMDKLNEELKAQYVISFHSSGDEVLYPYVCHKNQIITDQDVYYDLKDRLASHLGYGKRYASSSGEDFEHHFNKHGSLSFLLEIGKSFQPRFSTYKSTVKPKILKILPFLVNELKTGFVTFEVKYKNNQAQSGVKIDIAQAPLKLKEVRITDTNGQLMRKVNQSVIDVTLSKDGKTKSLQVKLPTRQSQKVNITF